MDPTISFDQVGGLDSYIKSLKEMVFLPLVYPELFERFHVQPPRGVLFYGPPGDPLQAKVNQHIIVRVQQIRELFVQRTLHQARTQQGVTSGPSCCRGLEGNLKTCIYSLVQSSISYLLQMHQSHASWWLRSPYVFPTLEGKRNGMQHII